MITVDQMPGRLLPWSDDRGRPCYLVGGGQGRVSQLADATERKQLAYAEELLDVAEEVIGSGEYEAEDLDDLGGCLVFALRNVHRVARSRGQRLEAYLVRELAAAADPEEAEEEEKDPRLADAE
ncbi:hypothetical protein RM844_29965 [Streptomyces sp. DSM 44915]|uniref:NTP pyrophosphohydrolase MazG putative catalytic core domain-containing protein n=1 Tax=Streptomyces chisholmiae TaxID=3075540 RepID=A0ABU2JZS7_9ACTN|nr:hypothetical protein [Streptomyces sp. DSM 44915]MDT0270506.1 hypothetical protein [Streptomyces sp. DSM 44915]